MAELPVLDAHVHFWDPGELEYPWLADVPPLRRAFLPADYTAAVEEVPVRRLVFVEANPRADQGTSEARWVASLAGADPRIAAVVAYVDLLDGHSGARAMDELAAIPLVRGIRHNIQGHAVGFCLQPAFVEGVREAGRRGLTFDLCATHHQLGEVLELCRSCPETPLVLDHCGKPAIGAGPMEPWASRIAELASLEHVHCKLSGLLTETVAGAGEEEMLPYALEVVERFGARRLMYGSDWPVLTLAGAYRGWYEFTRRLTREWSADERADFYGETAARFYGG